MTTGIFKRISKEKNFIYRNFVGESVTYLSTHVQNENKASYIIKLLLELIPVNLYDLLYIAKLLNKSFCKSILDYHNNTFT